MARENDAQCKFCRRENMKLFLKGDRCMTEKCAFERRAYPPGQHGHRRTKLSDYGLQLREKQKVKHIYGILEKQFRRYYSIASKKKGATGLELLRILETRLDNVVYRLGFGDSRAEARQLVKHSHFLVNGKPVAVSNYILQKGDEISIVAKSQQKTPILRAMQNVSKREVPDWLELNQSEFKGTVKYLPERNHITLPIEENLIVELYSR